ncbi:MAG: response regulator [Gemmatimonadetes bacterium]|nr:response regulator [Gemmatimonadota bacterium]
MAEKTGLNILLVEDNPTERWLFTELLRSRGHTVTACEDAESGWEEFLQDLPSLILLDWVLPGMDGIELCRKIREHPAGERTVIIVVTGRNSAEDLREVMAAGADDYIAKPVDVDLMNIRLAVAERNVQELADRVHTKQALEATTAELQELFENLDEVYFTLDVASNALVQISPACEQVLGYAAHQLLAEDGLLAGLLHPEELKTLARASGQEGNPPVSVHEYEIETGRGERRWLRARLRAGYDDRGELSRIDGVLADRTERRRAQEQLAARTQELLTLHRISQILMAASSLQDTYDEILEEICDATGYPIAAVEYFDEERDRMIITAARGFPALEDGGTLEIDAHQTLSGVAVRTGEPVVVEDARERKEHTSDDLHRMGLRAYLSFPLIVPGAVAGSLTLAHTEVAQPDVRMVRWAESVANSIASFIERMEAEEALKESEHQYRTLAEQLQQANDELQAFAYSVSHDLRAPLRTMQGFAHALVQNFGSSLDPEARDYARRIIDSGQQSEKLIGDLLAYSRLSFEELKFQAVDLNEVVSSAREQMGADLEEAKASLEIDDALPEVRGHQTTLVQVVANLLSNAIKFVEGGETPEVRIRYEESDGRVRLWVEDNGIGIREGQRERLFKVFERLQEGEDRPGTGIGLAIVRRGMERIGGQAGLESEHGKGSRFWIELPRYVAPGRKLWRKGRSTEAEG